MKPTIGAIIRYVEMDGKLVLPAIVTGVVSDTEVNLCATTDVDGTPVAGPPSLSWRYSVLFDGSANPAPKTWHWPPTE
jgi:hypothetical protein